MRLIERITVELRTRGVIGFLRFLGTRILQRREDVLFELRLTERGTTGTARESRPLDVVMIGRENLGSVATVAVERSVLNEQNYAYREALLGKDLLFAAIDDNGQVLTYGFVLFDSFYKRVLGEAVEVPMIGNCFTFPFCRRRGLYARLLISIGDYLESAGHERTIITCAPDNLASIRGIQNAGFSRIKTMRSVVLFSRWIVFQSSSFAQC